MARNCAAWPTSAALMAIVLDIGLAGEDGMAVARQIRSESSVPLIFLSGYSSEDMIVKGLALGADDYVTKPCQSKVLVARIENALRRKMQHQSVAPAPSLKIGAITFDVGRRVLIHSEGRRSTLTEKESRILAALALADNQSLSRDALYKSVFGREWDCEIRVLEVHISHLRRKLNWIGCDKGTIASLRGLGYRLYPPS
jgi:DNA-binding response OmpR family regulator